MTKGCKPSKQCWWCPKYLLACDFLRYWSVQKCWLFSLNQSHWLLVACCLKIQHLLLTRRRAATILSSSLGDQNFPRKSLTLRLVPSHTLQHSHCKVWCGSRGILLTIFHHHRSYLNPMEGRMINISLYVSIQSSSKDFRSRKILVILNYRALSYKLNW